ncbi:UNVERIFIED_ORG: GH25 family lysozyme M1 (1,4-beta-N-acetylmuramidase) [Rhizobium sp. SORGH_AS285]|nr:GH25 family lysozyme M1 (1,4-beta-N-acetylmuramidase) [Rhizobium sp. SORGH_AS_0285]
MRLRLSALLSALLLIGGCTSTSYDLLETASVSKPKFSDTDPQDFGVNNPHRHEVHGIDVSKWNGDVDWQTVRKSGVSFVFIKATEGSDRIDPKFGDHWRSAAAANILHAPYHFYYFCSTADAQADWFIRNVPKDAVTLPPTGSRRGVEPCLPHLQDAPGSRHRTRRNAALPRPHRSPLRQTSDYLYLG